MIRIEYNVKLKNLAIDIKYYFQKNKKIYSFFLFFFFIGLLVGIVIAFSTDSYVSLLTTKDKIFYDYVNGKADFGKETMKLILSFLVFQGVVFLLNLNFYSGMISFLLTAYQSALMFLSISALISSHGFGGVLITIFLIFPVNLVLVATNIIFSAFCVSRSFGALKMKKFSYGFDKKFWGVIIAFILFGIAFSYLINIIFMIVLKRRFFIIF